MTVDDSAAAQRDEQLYDFFLIIGLIIIMIIKLKKNKFTVKS